MELCDIYPGAKCCFAIICFYHHKKWEVVPRGYERGLSRKWICM